MGVPDHKRYRRSRRGEAGLMGPHVGIGLAAVALVALVGGSVTMMLAMGDHMGSMHWRGNSVQTPVVSDAAQVQVDIRNFEFVPRDLTVRPGATVTWTNADAVPHDATADSGDWRTDTLNQRDSGSVTFDEPGTYSYICTIHPYMTATVTVG